MKLKAFSLLEVLIMLVVVSFTMISAMTLVAKANISIKNNEKLDVVNTLLFKSIELLKSPSQVYMKSEGYNAVNTTTDVNQYFRLVENGSIKYLDYNVSGSTLGNNCTASSFYYFPFVVNTVNQSYLICMQLQVKRTRDPVTLKYYYIIQTTVQYNLDGADVDTTDTLITYRYETFSFRTKVKKAYSLLELMISLAIIALATTVMINFLVISVKISVQSLARTFVREEVSNAVVLIARDIRNADKVIFDKTTNCPNPSTNICQIELTISGQKYRWSKCADGSSYRVCKDIWDSTAGAYVNNFKTSQSVNIDYMDIDFGYSISGNNTEINVLVTMSASHAKSGLGITNIVRQSSASTRNYEF